MRIVRMIFVAAIGLILVAIAIANRGPVTLHLLPDFAETWTARPYDVTLPLFLVILVALLVGMVIGLVWEWLREAQLRRESDRRARDIAELEREAAARQPSRDPVLALLETPPPAAGATTALPARR